MSRDGEIAVAAAEGLFVGNGELQRVLPRDGNRSWAVVDARGVAYDSAGRLWFASPQGAGLRESGKWTLFTGLEGLPEDDFTTVSAGEPGIVWFGTRRGAIRFDGKTWEYRQGLRWLPDDDVRAIAVTARGDAWFATDKGAGVIERRPMTLAEKAKFFEDEIDRYHRRTEYGYVMAVTMRNPGDKSADPAARQRQRRPVDQHVRRRRVLRLRRDQGPARETARQEGLRSAEVPERRDAGRRASRARADSPPAPSSRPAAPTRTLRDSRERDVAPPGRAGPPVEDHVAALAQERRRQVVLEIGHQLRRARRPLLLLRASTTTSSPRRRRRRRKSAPSSATSPTTSSTTASRSSTTTASRRAGAISTPRRSTRPATRGAIAG